jgi:hypothetical protein
MISEAKVKTEGYALRIAIGRTGDWRVMRVAGG